MSGSVETAYDCKRPPEGKTFTICNLYYLASGERTLQIYHWLWPALAFIMESRVETHIWRHMYSFQLLVCVCVPEAFFHSCAWPCSSTLFLCFSLCMCMSVSVCVCSNVCVWLCKLLTLSVFMLATRTSARQFSETFIISCLFFFFFVFQNCCWVNPYALHRQNKWLQ